MRKIAAALLMSLAVSFPAYAQVLHDVLPNYDYHFIEDTVLGCYDLEGAKLLREADLKCAACLGTVEDYRQKNSALTEENATLHASNVSFQEANTSLGAALAISEADRNQAIVDKWAARERDILGGAFPWVLVTAVSAFALGLGVGVWVAN